MPSNQPLEIIEEIGDAEHGALEEKVENDVAVDVAPLEQTEEVTDSLQTQKSDCTEHTKDTIGSASHAEGTTEQDNDISFDLEISKPTTQPDDVTDPNNSSFDSENSQPLLPILSASSETSVPQVGPKSVSLLKRRFLLYFLCVSLIVVFTTLGIVLAKYLAPSDNATSLTDSTAISSGTNKTKTDGTIATAPKKPLKVPRKPVRKPKSQPVSAPSAPIKTLNSTVVQTDFKPIFINPGSVSSFIDATTNEVWIEDMFYTGGLDVESNDCRLSSKNRGIDRMRCSYRIFRGNATRAMYNIPLPDLGSYDVTLYFEEPFYNEPNRRVFDVVVEDVTVLSQFDIYQKARGLSILYISNITTDVEDGDLTIEFKQIKSFPIISGIEIRRTPLNTTSAANVQSSLLTNITSDNVTSSYDNMTSSYQSFNDTSIDPSLISYQPGNLSGNEIGIRLSAGLTIKTIAKTGHLVDYSDGTRSTQTFHREPDAGATFPDPNPKNSGGWIYVSNSEVLRDGNDKIIYNQGGVGAITFDKDGNIIHYTRLLNESTANCGGGRTPWGTWISGEEYRDGTIYQVDPTGLRPSEKIFMGLVNPGSFESFSYDARDKTAPRFFASKDDPRGEMTRFTPFVSNWVDPWRMLTSPGEMEYLIIEPSSDLSGTYRWTTNLTEGKSNAGQYFPNAEGIDVYKNSLYFITKKKKLMYILNLDSNTYTVQSTHHGLFAGQPDQIIHLTNTDDSLLYFTEDGGQYAGVHARDRSGSFYTILEGTNRYSDETTGLSFSPDGKRLYFAYQDEGVLMEVTRLDGLPFYGNTLNVKYHSRKR